MSTDLYSQLRSLGFAKFLGKVRRVLYRKIWTAYSTLTHGKYVRSEYGILMRANWRDRTFGLCISGSYGAFYSHHLENLNLPFVFLDIGANQGLYSILAAKNENCICVFAFEPVTKTFGFLVDNISQNDLVHRIRPVKAAISSRSGHMTIEVDKNHSGRSSVDRKLEARSTYSETINLLRPSNIDSRLPETGEIVAKVDVEGHELVVITELVGCKFFRRVESVFYEVDERWTDPNEIETVLRNGGLRHFVKIGSGTHYDVLASRSQPAAYGKIAST